MTDESYRYKPVNLKWDNIARDNNIKKLSTPQIEKKIESAKKLTQEAYDRANKLGYKDQHGNKLDITKPLKQQ